MTAENTALQRDRGPSRAPSRYVRKALAHCLLPRVMFAMQNDRTAPVLRSLALSRRLVDLRKV
jgi:hypothetical protein